MGDFYKNPRYPIYVVCSESHYTVLFAKAHVQRADASSAKDTRLEFYYYDQLGQQDEEIHLTIGTATLTTFTRAMFMIGM